MHSPGSSWKILFYFSSNRLKKLFFNSIHALISHIILSKILEILNFFSIKINIVYYGKLKIVFAFPSCVNHKLARRTSAIFADIFSILSILFNLVKKSNAASACFFFII